MHEKPPFGSERIWELAELLKQTRDHGFASIPPITQREMQAFQKNMWIRLKPFHIEALIAIDATRRRVWQKRREADSQAQTAQREAARRGKFIDSSSDS